MKTHELKCIAPYFEQVISGKKNFEVRLNDRNYEIGDKVIQREFYFGGGDGSGEYTGREVDCGTIIYILKDYPALKENYIVFGFSPPLIPEGKPFVTDKMIYDLFDYWKDDTADDSDQNFIDKVRHLFSVDGISEVKQPISDAVEFAEFCQRRWEKLPTVGKNVGKWREKGKDWMEAIDLTTSQLYSLFLSEKKEDNTECDHYFPVIKHKFQPCEFCGAKKYYL